VSVLHLAGPAGRVSPRRARRLAPKTAALLVTDMQSGILDLIPNERDAGALLRTPSL
jgi:hypothetical protein